MMVRDKHQPLQIRLAGLCKMLVSFLEQKPHHDALPSSSTIIINHELERSERIRHEVTSGNATSRKESLVRRVHLEMLVLNRNSVSRPSRSVLSMFWPPCKRRDASRCGDIRIQDVVSKG